MDLLPRDLIRLIQSFLEGLDWLHSTMLCRAWRRASLELDWHRYVDYRELHEYKLTDEYHQRLERAVSESFIISSVYFSGGGRYVQATFDSKHSSRPYCVKVLRFQYPRSSCSCPDATNTKRAVHECKHQILTRMLYWDQLLKQKCL